MAQTAKIFARSGKGLGPGVVAISADDAGIIAFHGDPKLGETTVSNDAGEAGIFGASENGDGVLGYARDARKHAVYAFGGLKAIALGRPFSAEFVGDVHVEGDIRVDGDILLTGADCAEQFDVADERDIAPGEVVVIGHNGALCQSRRAYDTTVAGVVAGAGTYRPGIVLDRQEVNTRRLLVSLIGKVFCKVDGQYAPIAVGDLLTSSPTPGHAMKAADPNRAFGAIIGKALQPWNGGSGLIPILIALG